MRISRAEIEHVAKLARLHLSEEEKEVFTGQIDAILSYVEKLNGLNTENVTPTSHAVPVENAFREDSILPSLPVDEAMSNSPEHTGDFFRVPQVIE